MGRGMIIMTDSASQRVQRSGEYDEMPREDAPGILESNASYRIDGEIYIVYRGQLWRRTGQTHNPRVMGQADAVAWNGELLRVSSDGPTIILQHHMAGVEHRIYASQRTTWCFVTFEEVDQL